MQRLVCVLIGLTIILSAQSLGQRRYENGFDTTYYTAKGISKAIKADRITVLEKAEEIRNEYPGEFSIEQISAAFNYLYTNWDYEPDPGYEYFKPAGMVIEKLNGDCDDYAIGMVALMEALGGQGRIVAVSGHAYPEVFIGKDLSETDLNSIIDRINGYYDKHYGYEMLIGNVNYHVDPDGSFWLNLDYQIDYPGGTFYEYSENAEHVLIFSDGSYRTTLLNQELSSYISKRNKTSS